MKLENAGQIQELTQFWTADLDSANGKKEGKIIRIRLNQTISGEKMVIGSLWSSRFATSHFTTCLGSLSPYCRKSSTRLLKVR